MGSSGRVLVGEQKSQICTSESSLSLSDHRMENGLDAVVKI